MPRTARIVVPGVPHHVTQRGARRLPTFFCAEDYERYRSELSTACRKHDVDVWAYCLMPNHAHAILVPESEKALQLAVGLANKKYAREINKREGWRGHFWQYRFASFPMDARHSLNAARYVELNPVRAGMVVSALEYPWSSARAHLAGQDDRLVRVAPLLQRVPDWGAFIRQPVGPELLDLLRRHGASGAPLGDEDFVREVEARLGRVVVPRAA